MKDLGWKRRLASNLFTSLCMLLIILAVWLPDYLHFRISPDPITPAMMQASRSSPADDVLERVTEVDLMGLTMAPELQFKIAQQIRDGYVDDAVYAPQKVVLRGWPGDWQGQAGISPLLLAGLSLESLLLRAYERTLQPAYLDLAKQRVFQFIRFEAQASPPMGLIWNDHAIASRVSVLGCLWGHLRANPETTTQEMLEMLEAVQRSAEYLAKDSHFTVQTNHGIMQNIALLQLSLAFPALNKADEWKQKATSRLYQQLAFYISPEGVILEHSPGYHLFGLRLLEHARTLYQIAGMELPDQLDGIYKKAGAYLAAVLREDCSLPLVGNTSGWSRKDLELSGSECRNIAQTKQKISAQYFEQNYPISGYSIWGDGRLNSYQTFVAWAKFDHHPHKHADEPSVHFWSKGTEWLTAIGYWPYGTAGYKMASAWGGANAPHADNESRFSQRDSRLHFFGGERELKMVDIETKRAHGFLIRRQVVQLDPDHLLVLDFASGAAAEVLTNWILGPHLVAKEVTEAELMVTNESAASRLNVQLFYDGSSKASSALFKGSQKPLLGWTVVDQQPLATSAWQVRRSGAAHATGTLFSLSHGADEASRQANFIGTVSPDAWSVELHAGAGATKIQRQGDVLQVVSGAGTRSVRLLPGPTVDAARAQIARRISAAMQEFPRWRNLEQYRDRVIWFVLAAGLALLLVPYSIRSQLRYLIWFEFGVAGASIGAVLFLHFAYFV